MPRCQNLYDPARAAARRWLERSQSPEYQQLKRQAHCVRYQLGVLTRNARRTGDYTAIALIEKLKAEMLSHSRREVP